MKRLFLMMFIPGLFLFSCSSNITYNYDWDRDEDLSRYSTYAWMSVPAEMPANVQAARTNNDLLDKRIRRAVDAGLSAKGLRLVESNQTFNIVYHIGSEDKVSVTDWGYRYGPGPWGYYGRDIDVRQYTQGTLIIDFVDAETSQLFWRGEATKSVYPNATQEEIDETINEAVAGILRNWPPSGENAR